VVPEWFWRLFRRSKIVLFQLQTGEGCGSDFLKMYFCVRPPSKPCFASTNEHFYVKNVVLGALFIVQKVHFQEIPTTFASKVEPLWPDENHNYFFSKKKV
jgi:hypothetical protein